jgi:hypothetical protein
MYTVNLCLLKIKITKYYYKYIFQLLKFYFKAKHLKWRVSICWFKWCVTKSGQSCITDQCKHTQFYRMEYYKQVLTTAHFHRSVMLRTICLSLCVSSSFQQTETCSRHDMATGTRIPDPPFYQLLSGQIRDPRSTTLEKNRLTITLLRRLS